MYVLLAMGRIGDEANQTRFRSRRPPVKNGIQPPGSILRAFVEHQQHNGTPIKKRSRFG